MTTLSIATKKNTLGLGGDVRSKTTDPKVTDRHTSDFHTQESDEDGAYSVNLLFDTSDSEPNSIKSIDSDKTEDRLF